VRILPTTIAGTHAVAFALLLAAAPLRAQTTPPDAWGLARGGDLTHRGVGSGADSTPRPAGNATASPANPAALADGEGWAATLTPLRLTLGLTPITGRDLVRAGDGVLTRARREAWLRRLDGGVQTGVGEAIVGPLALRRGSWAVELATTAVGRTRLPADAVELLLFGNAGRSGTPRDFRLTDSALDGAAFTSIGVARGTRLTERLAMGVRGHATIGHGVLTTRDAGSVLSGDDATADVRLPTITSTGFAPGFGVGLDLGATWRGGGGTTGVVLRNAATTFAWSDDDLRLREGETLVEGEGVSSDFDARPVSEAPAALRALLRRLRPARRLEIEHVRPLTQGVHLRFVLRARVERGISPAAPDARLVGMSWDVSERLALAAHTGAVEGDLRLGAGARIRFGGWALSGAWALDRGDDREGSTLALTLGWSPR